MADKDAFYEHKEFDLITFGETMLRLSPPVNELIYKSDTFKKHAGGAELNVACGVSLLGCRSGIITRLPKNQLGTFIKNRIRSSSVSDDFIIFDESPEARVGIYYYENGAYPRKPTVVYDRKNSSITKIQESEIPSDIYGKTRMFYTSGITLALSDNTRNLALDMIKKFKAEGARIAFDINYRTSLWDEDTARNAIKQVLPYVDVLFISEESCRRMFRKTGTLEEMHREFCRDYPNIRLIATSQREVISPKIHSFGSTVYLKRLDKFYREEPYREIDVVDRIGSGDAYCAGVLFGLLKYDDAQKAVEFGNATCATKNTIFGDLPVSDFAEIQSIIKAHQSTEGQSEMNR
ncbi:sugar kinase [Treponema pectinovorum]|uniref:sugar kinase n=1 Tax=Treponema pectinovorum TaxID=164 RepID=UPI0011CC6561|nr:sugar kinase [Treponema pectinovorum]